MLLSLKVLRLAICVFSSDIANTDPNADADESAQMIMTIIMVVVGMIMTIIVVVVGMIILTIIMVVVGITMTIYMVVVRMIILTMTMTVEVMRMIVLVIMLVIAQSNKIKADYCDLAFIFLYFHERKGKIQ